MDITSVTDLAVSNVQWDRATLTWTSPPATPGTGDLPASYDVRYLTSPITEANWGSATSVAGVPVPGAPGTPETFVVTGLAESTQYYFAVKEHRCGRADKRPVQCGNPARPPSMT